MPADVAGGQAFPRLVGFEVGPGVEGGRVGGRALGVERQVFDAAAEGQDQERQDDAHALGIGRADRQAHPKGGSCARRAAVDFDVAAQLGAQGAG